MTDLNHPLEGVRRVHFVGIGGSGMSPLAEILHAKGYQLSGSDNNESDNLILFEFTLVAPFLNVAANTHIHSDLLYHIFSIS